MSLLLSILLSLLPLSLYFLSFHIYVSFFVPSEATSLISFVFLHFFLDLQGTALSDEVFIQLLSIGAMLFIYSV